MFLTKRNSNKISDPFSAGSENTSSKTIRSTFPRKEHLKSKKIISSLFDKGNSIVIHPFRLLFLNTELPSPVAVQATFTVPKRNFPKATDRNLIKRRISESYRLNKVKLIKILEEGNLQYAILFIYLSKEVLEHPLIEEKIRALIDRLIKEINGENIRQNTDNSH